MIRSLFPHIQPYTGPTIASPAGEQDEARSGGRRCVRSAEGRRVVAAAVAAAAAVAGSGRQRHEER